jgi:ABC-2 type transport system permease protein
MFLAPAVMMKSIAGEKMQGTYVLLLSKPLRISDIILSKFLAGLSVVFLTILPTLIYCISIYYLSYPLGNVDLGGMIGSYLGLLLLAACFIAISLFSSCLSNNIIVAFLLAVLFNLFITYLFI